MENLSESELKNEIEKKAKEAARAKEELEQILYVASHDLQAPLRTIASYIQLIERSIQKGDTQTATEFMKFVMGGAETMQTLIQDLLAYSRITTKGQEFTEVDLNQSLKSAQAQLIKKIMETGAKISSDELPKVKGDSSQLSILFQNLLDNALKFRSPERAPEVKVSVKNNDEHYQISMEDNGIGFDEKFYQRIFVIFQRLHAKEKYEGTGLGLAVGKKIVERHGGEIWVTSEPGKGSIFHFTIKK